MDWRRHGTLFLIVGALMGSSEGYTFQVGGRDGWVLNPKEPYQKWAARNRFQIGDVLSFNPHNDSVLQVSKPDYDTCNTKSPNQTLTATNASYKLDRSGPYYFISGDPGACRNGKKLTVVVMAVRGKPRTAGPPQSMAPSATPSQAPPLPPVATPIPGGVAAPGPGVGGPTTTPTGSNVPTGTPPSRSGSWRLEGHSPLIFSGVLGMVVATIVFH